MKKFIVLTFLFMGWAFYELSGGADFQPPVRQAPSADQVAAADETIFVTPESDAVAEAVPTTQVSQSQAQPAAQPLSQNVATDPNIVLAAAAPSLVGTATPTPTAELAKLGPTEAEIAAQAAQQANDEKIFSLATAPQSSLDFRRVSGNRVNMRNGPGTEYSVVAKLGQFTEVEVLQNPGEGWVKLQVLETGRIGWMAERLLTKN